MAIVSAQRTGYTIISHNKVLPSLLKVEVMNPSTSKASAGCTKNPSIEYALNNSSREQVSAKSTVSTNYVRKGRPRNDILNSCASLAIESRSEVSVGGAVLGSLLVNRRRRPLSGNEMNVLAPEKGLLV